LSQRRNPLLKQGFWAHRMNAQHHHIAQFCADLVAAMRYLVQRKLNHNNGGNVSLRCGDSVLITPTGMTPEQMVPTDIVQLDLRGNLLAGTRKPSSEWEMHLAVYRNRPDIHAVVHCHSRYATTLACTGKSIPALHYMIASAGGTTIPLAPYRLFGSAELAAAVADTLRTGYACLLANHGQLAIGADLNSALQLSEEVEELAAVYWGTLAIGGPQLLSDKQMSEAIDQFVGYGQQP
jgi:L-fuculose-phosphate aldolase